MQNEKLMSPLRGHHNFTLLPAGLPAGRQVEIYILNFF